ncbi:Uncharacterized protein FWK35_00031163 [Aphis craccivora]|uniref:Uncharacterized protein n=1 Tax=Aphis craccivora TaxID=307492 RepID=A0A6G0VSF0_APHCR|nr:Uncharacterized protein FWK35_00031163 [Aphis craccivora]
MQHAVPGPMSFNGNIANNWKQTRKRLLSQGITIFNTFSFNGDDEQENYDIVVGKFKEYCEPQKNIIYERFKFYKCSQKPNQLYDSFLTELKSISNLCEFTNVDEMVRDRIVMGISNGGMQERLLRESGLTLKRAIDLCRTTEAARVQHQKMESKSVVLSIQEETRSQQSQKWMKNNQVKTNIASTKTEGKIGNTVNKFKTNFEKNCKKCNRKHGPKNCPAFDKICNFCKKNNKKLQQVTEENSTKNTSDGDFSGLFRIDSIIKVQSIEKAWWHEVQINNYKERSCDSIIETYGGFKVKPLGLLIVVRIW